MLSHVNIGLAVVSVIGRRGDDRRMDGLCCMPHCPSVLWYCWTGNMMSCKNKHQPQTTKVCLWGNWLSMQ